MLVRLSLLNIHQSVPSTQTRQNPNSPNDSSCFMKMYKSDIKRLNCFNRRHFSFESFSSWKVWNQEAQPRCIWAQICKTRHRPLSCLLSRLVKGRYLLSRCHLSLITTPLAFPILLLLLQASSEQAQLTWPLCLGRCLQPIHPHTELVADTLCAFLDNSAPFQPKLRFHSSYHLRSILRIRNPWFNRQLFCHNRLLS